MSNAPRYSDAEMQVIREAVAAGETRSQIAARIGRPQNGIKSKMRAEGIRSRVPMGRPSLIPRDIITRAVALRRDGLGIKIIAAKLGRVDYDRLCSAIERQFRREDRV